MITTKQHTFAQAEQSTIPSRCLLISGPGQIELAETRIPSPGQGEILVHSHWSCVSPGTEKRVLDGTEHGLPKSPFIPGYAMTGTVVATGENCRLVVGDTVFCNGTQRADHPLCWGGHTEFAVLPEAKAIRIPNGMDLKLASAAKLAAIAYHGLRLSQPMPGETVAVIGLGPIGLLSALLHAQSGASVLATDRCPERCQMASNLGLTTLTAASTLRETFADIPDGGADIVVEATGVPAVLLESAQLLKPKPWDNTWRAGARLLIQASYPGRPAIAYHDIFMAEATIHVPRDCQRQDVEAVLELMAHGKLPIADFIGDAGNPKTAAATFLQSSHNAMTQITCAINWRA